MNLLTQLRWHFRKARYGNKKAQVKVGLLLAKIEDEFGRPLYWFSRAAMGARPPVRSLEGHGAAVEGLYNMGVAYEQGSAGVDQNFKQAAKYYRDAAEEGHRDAQAVLGSMYWEGRGVDQDPKQAAEWWLRAAERRHRPPFVDGGPIPEGHADAQYNMSWLYDNVPGVERPNTGVEGDTDIPDKELSLLYLYVAAKNGNTKALTVIGFKRHVPDEAREIEDIEKRLGRLPKGPYLPFDIRTVPLSIHGYWDGARA